MLVSLQHSVLILINFIPKEMTLITLAVVYFSSNLISFWFDLAYNKIINSSESVESMCC
jgi:hypothetical protein